MDATQLTLLALIERHGSLAAVAEQLGRTPAAVTQQLARAERDLQTALVRRGPRGATLTAAGAVLAAHGHVVNDEIRASERELANLLGVFSRRLRIGAFQAAALHLLPPALTALRHRYAEAELTVGDVPSGRGIEEVASGRLDLAIVAAWDIPPSPPDHVRAHLLLEDPMVVVLPEGHPALGRPSEAGSTHHPAGSGSIDLARLSDEAWVTILAGHAARAQFDRLAADAGFTPRIRFTTESYDVAQAFVGTGIGVALVSRLALTDVPHTTHRQLTPPAPHRSVYAMVPADSAATPLVAQFLTLLLDVCAELRANWTLR